MTAIGILVMCLTFVGVIALALGVFALTKRIRRSHPAACPRCGMANPAPAKVCASCGAPLHAAVQQSTVKQEVVSTESDKTAGTMSCPKCGEQLKEASRFCTSCGARIGAERPVAEAAKGERQLEPSLPLLLQGAESALAAAEGERQTEPGPQPLPHEGGRPVAEAAKSEKQLKPAVEPHPPNMPQKPTPGRWRMARMAGAGLLVLALFFFLLPWLDLTCAGEKVETLSGVDMLTGSEYQAPSGYYGETETYRSDPEWLAIAAFGVGVVGIGLFFLRTRMAAVARGALGILGAAFLLGLKFKIDSDIQNQGEGVIGGTYLAGYWLTFLCFVAAAIVSFLPFAGFIFDQHDGPDSK